MSRKGWGLVVLASVLSLSSVPVALPQSCCPVPQGLTESQRQKIDAMNEIAAAQRVLREYGLYYGDTNGIISREFEQALRNYQRLHQLVPTGILDPQTMCTLGIVKVTIPTETGAAQLSRGTVTQNTLCYRGKNQLSTEEAKLEKPNNIVPNRKPNANRV